MTGRAPHLRRLRAGLTLAVLGAALAACQSNAPRRPGAPGVPGGEIPPVSSKPPIDVWAVPNAVPRVEPRSPYGNPPFYDVFGKRYYVRRRCRGYDKRGVASWYGPGFYEDQTSTHEPYDMYAMTAAHKTLPLPCYVRVTNLQNGRSVIVRVNDRGPFVKNRIIDLSYAAAVKLGMLRKGTAMVEVRSIDPTAPWTAPGPGTANAADPAGASAAAAAPATAPATTAPRAAPVALFIQTGAFADPANAERLLHKLRDNGYADSFVRDAEIGGRRLYRVRIGPVKDVDEYDRIVDELARIGVEGAHLALN
ncbi:MAG TPA: septal ring lytic transglycosylase RlpA family protein [Steroidobacteraceae bacterium]|nr:septal ring lytic transglycosylase RlpA family protein [Steroidobacteraceae bacterium]